MAMSPALPRTSAPPRWQDYVQLLKPRVMSLVIFTAITGMVCADSSVNPILGAIAIFCIAVGAGASAAFNMWYDADIDAKMRRTRARPVPSGKVQGSDALAMGGVLSMFSVMLLGMTTNWLAAGLLVIAVAAPLIEELCKSLAVPLVWLAGRPLTRIDAFLLGAAAGAGFALMEGITNGALALAEPQSWASLMLVRAGVAAIHALASGLAGLAWHAVLRERRWARGIGLFAAAVATHGAWNGGAFLVVWFGWRNMGREATLDVMYAMILALLICLFALSALAWTLAGAAVDEQPWRRVV